MYAHDARGLDLASTARLEQAALPMRPQMLAPWREAPPWGGSWGDFFAQFHRAAVLGQPGLRFTDLFTFTFGDRHATAPEIRQALHTAREAGLVVLLKDETPKGTEEYFLLNPSWLLDEIFASAQGVALTAARMSDGGEQALEQLRRFSFAHCAQQNGFEGGSALTVDGLLEFFREGPYSATELYKASALYPLGAERFSYRVREFIDQVLTAAVEAGVLEVITSEEGRDLYQLAQVVSQPTAAIP